MQNLTRPRRYKKLKKFFIRFQYKISWQQPMLFSPFMPDGRAVRTKKISPATGRLGLLKQGAFFQDDIAVGCAFAGCDYGKAFLCSVVIIESAYVFYRVCAAAVIFCNDGLVFVPDRRFRVIARFDGHERDGLIHEIVQREYGQNSV